MKNKSVYELLAGNIRNERKKRGLTIEELSGRAGISVSFLCYIETNKKKPSLETISRISSALDVPLSGLFAENGDKQPRSDIYYACKTFEGLVKEATSKQRRNILDIVKTAVKGFK